MHAYVGDQVRLQTGVPLPTAAQPAGILQLQRRRQNAEEFRVVGTGRATLTSSRADCVVANSPPVETACPLVRIEATKHGLLHSISAWLLVALALLLLGAVGHTILGLLWTRWRRVESDPASPGWRTGRRIYMQRSISHSVAMLSALLIAAAIATHVAT